ncbi:Serine transporter [Serratia rubidaea]|uniref:Serine transporter n=1 Tax=Serratia rubidaea TaxID=61652 RepID=A0A447QTG1_SERRU|nr:Serine transporter [Serratia rubidaea]
MEPERAAYHRDHQRPLIAVILFILPMYAVRAVPSMHKYRALSNVFVLVMGLIALSALIYGLM